jgi:hypothetical protein
MLAILNENGRQPKGACHGYVAMSEVELQGKLHFACVLRRAKAPEIGIPKAGIWRVIVCVVKEVEEVHPELHFHGFCDRDVFLQAQVSIDIPRPNNRTL